jgi:radical SAM-linked protein
MKLRLEITKGEALRYISHLDYVRTMERALRRAKLPVAYSEGFNPHMKMAFASALSLGVTSDSEYMDVELKSDISPEDFAASLVNQLPEGILLKGVREISVRHAALMAVINLAAYRINVPLQSGDFTAAQECINSFNQAQMVQFVKESPKGKREINVKQYVSQAAIVQAPCGIEISMTVAITPTGSVKPSDVLKTLVDQFGLAVNPAAALINRTGLYVDGLSPLDVGQPRA